MDESSSASDMNHHPVRGYPRTVLPDDKWAYMETLFPGMHNQSWLQAACHRVPTTRGNCMREYLMPIFVVAVLALAGCNKSKSPEDVSKDVANAEQKASNEVTKSEDRAQSALDKSYQKINDQEIKFNNDAAHQTYNVAVAKADGNRKVALATCESQSGDAQKACRDQAEADYNTARAACFDGDDEFYGRAIEDAIVHNRFDRNRRSTSICGIGNRDAKRRDAFQALKRVPLNIQVKSKR